MDSRLRGLAEQLDAHEISRREFLRRSAVITGGAAAGLHVLGSMAHAQGPKLRVWLFKSYVTAGNDILAKKVEAGAAARKAHVEFDWGTFRGREQKVVAAIQGRDPPHIPREEYQGALTYPPA